MPSNLSFPYDAELFNYSWKNAPDTVLTNMIESGAVVRDSEIERLISNGSNYFTIPFYNVLGGTPSVYNGVNDIVPEATTGNSMSGVVYGRQQGWSVKTFINDFNSGADPMSQVVNGVARFWQKQRQKDLVGILKAVFQVGSDADWAKHTYNIASTETTVTDGNKVGVSTVEDACVKANGDMAEEYSLVIAHPVVANRWKNLQLVEYTKYTDERGISKDLAIGTINGKRLIITEQVPVKESGTATGEKEYTTYVLGTGAIRYADAPVEVPSEMDRDPAKAGGQDFLYTRVRQVLHPYGFSFKGNTTSDVGIPDNVLTAPASYERKIDAKAIYMCQIISNG